MKPGRLVIVLPAMCLALLVSAAGPLGASEGSAATARPTVSAATCTASEKATRQAAVVAYQKRIPLERKAFFRTHKSAKSRALFVKRQQAKLQALKAAATCTVPPPPAVKSLYVAIGDSLAAGVGAGADRYTTAYVPLFFTWLHAYRSLDSLSNRAWDDTGAATLGNQNSETIRSGGQLAKALADINGPTDTRVVTIDMGIGEPGCGVFSQCSFASNFAATLDDLNDALARDPGDETVFVLSGYNWQIGLPGEAREAVRILGTDLKVDCAGVGDELGLNDYLTCISGSKNVSVVDVYEVFRQAGQAYLGGDVHPNTAGYRAIADALIAQCIKICAASSPA